MVPDPHTVSDEELARLTQAGSLDAFEELVRRYEGRIHGFLASFRRLNADVGLVTQDTFVRAFQAITQFKTDKAFAPWLFTIARRKAIDHLRANPPPPDRSPLPEACDLNDPAELLAREEERKALWQCARRLLPDAQFEALWLRYVVDMDIAGIAQVLGKTQTHAKVLLFRARRLLGEELNRACTVVSVNVNHDSLPGQINVALPQKRQPVEKLAVKGFP